MAASYAASLSSYANKGVLGLPEHYDEKEELIAKIKQLANWIKSSKCCVIHTGAGISTAAGIPDFRGPKGVWTLEERNEQAESIDFDVAKPTFTHHAINALEKYNLIKFVISQNVDGLHVRSGYPLNRLAELHGNVFVEVCNKCHRRYYRDHAVGSVGFKLTGRKCEGTKFGRPCRRGELTDMCLDWEDALPEQDFKMATLYAKMSDLSICLGTTLQIMPSGELPLKAKKNVNGKMVTVNLQPTKYHNETDLVINGRVDEIMKMLLDELGITVNDDDSPKAPVLKSIHPIERKLLSACKRRSLTAKNT